MRYASQAEPERVSALEDQRVARESRVSDRRIADKVIEGINRVQTLSDGLYREGYRKGFVYGLVCGALGIALLAVVVLGDVLSG